MMEEKGVRVRTLLEEVLPPHLLPSAARAAPPA